MAITECVHSNRAMPPKRYYFLLMLGMRLEDMVMLNNDMNKMLAKARKAQNQVRYPMT